MWFAIGVVAVVVLIVAVLLRSSRSPSGDGPLPPEVVAQVLLGEEPEREPSDPPGHDDDSRR